MNKKRFDQINMIPFIDIMLVLLTIVLTTASFVSQGVIPVDLPNSETGVTQATNDNTAEPIEITITADNQWFYSDQLVDISTITDLLGTLALNSPVTLRIVKKANFSEFVTIFDLMKKRKFTNLKIVTETL